MGLLEGGQYAQGIMSNIAQGVEAGRGRRKQNSLAALAGQFYGGDQSPSLLAKYASEGGDAAPMAKYAAEQGDTAVEDTGRYVQMFSALPADQKAIAYPALVAKVNAMKMDHPPIPETYDPSYDAGIEKFGQILAQKSGKSGMTTPANLQEFDRMTQGMPAEDVSKARRINLGLDPRASSGLPFMQYKYTDAQGREVVETLDKRTGQSAAPGAAAGRPGMSAIQLAQNLQQFGGKVTSGYRSPSHNAEVGGVPNSYHMSGQALDVVMPNPQLKAQAKQYMESQGYQVIDEGDHLHAEPPKSDPNPYASRPAEQQAALTTGAQEQAKIDAQVGNAPRVAGAEAQVAAAKADAEIRAKAAAERQTNAQTSLPQTLATGNQALKLINDMLAHPGRLAATGLSSKLDPANKIPGTPAYDFNVKAGQLQGKVFLEAFQSLKGAGQITEVEGQKATAAIAALETAQSEQQYAQALRDLGAVIRGGMTRARTNAGRKPPQAHGGGVDDLLTKYGAH